MNKFIQSNKMHRLDKNPQEKTFLEVFNDQHTKQNNDVDLIVFGHEENSFTPKDYLNDREKIIVVSTIQWLGSPVGQGFLNNCGFSSKSENILSEINSLDNETLNKIRNSKSDAEARRYLRDKFKGND